MEKAIMNIRPFHSIFEKGFAIGCAKLCKDCLISDVVELLFRIEGNRGKEDHENTEWNRYARIERHGHRERVGESLSWT